MTGPRRELDERFADWVDGRLRPAERAALEAEMARDPELQRAAEEYRRSVQLLRSALAPGEYGPSIADAVLARVGPAPAAPPRAWRPYLASAMAAAALVLVFIVIRSIPPAPEASVESIAQSPSGVIPSGDLAGVRTVQEEAAATGEQEPPAATADRAVVAEGGVQPPPEAERVPARGAVDVEEARKSEGTERGDERVVTRSDPDYLRPGAVDPGDAGPSSAGPERTRSQVADERKEVAAGPRGGVPPAADPSFEEALDARLPGELAIVVDVAAGDRVFRELAARSRAGTNAAEILALVAPVPEGEAGDSPEVDLRRVAVEPRAVAPRRSAGVPDATGTTREQRGSAPRAADDTGLFQGASAMTLTVTPEDRVFAVRGSMRELRAFAAALQQRIAPDRGRVRYERFALPPAVAGERTTRAPARTERRGAVADDRARGAARDEEQTLELLLVLRPAQGR